MKTPASRLLIGLLLCALLLPARAQPVSAQSGPPAADTAQSEEVQPKFIWGLVLNIAVKFAMNAFTEWRTRKQSNNLTDSIDYMKLLKNSATAGLVSTAGGAVVGALGFKSVGASENTVADLPTKPIEVKDGEPNYQGLHVAVVGFDRAAQVVGLRPVTAGFRTGDRMKLKVLPTFDALLVIENINPQGARQQIYPPSASQAVALKAGVEVLLPLGADQFFEFAGATGDDQLVITVRDPRAFGDAESKAEVSRQDDAQGSSFVQEIRPGTYPVIAQSLKLRHER